MFQENLASFETLTSNRKKHSNKKKNYGETTKLMSCHVRCLDENRYKHLYPHLDPIDQVSLLEKHGS